MEDFMNPPIELVWGAADIVLVYNDCKDTKRIAKAFCISEKEVKEILKEAGIKVVPLKKELISESEKAHREVGMSQKDFYTDK